MNRWMVGQQDEWMEESLEAPTITTCKRGHIMMSFVSTGNLILEAMSHHVISETVLQWGKLQQVSGVVLKKSQSMLPYQITL